MAVANGISFATWMALVNNFAIERVNFTGYEIGILQSLREIPGFLAFTAVYLLLLWREQTLGLIALALLGIGTGITGLFPTEYAFYGTTILMSVGYSLLRDHEPVFGAAVVSQGRSAALAGQDHRRRVHGDDHGLWPDLHHLEVA